MPARAAVLRVVLQVRRPCRSRFSRVGSAVHRRGRRAIAGRAVLDGTGGFPVLRERAVRGWRATVHARHERQVARPDNRAARRERRERAEGQQGSHPTTHHAPPRPTPSSLFADGGAEVERRRRSPFWSDQKDDRPRRQQCAPRDDADRRDRRRALCVAVVLHAGLVRAVGGVGAEGLRRGALPQRDAPEDRPDSDPRDPYASQDETGGPKRRAVTRGRGGVRIGGDRWRRRGGGGHRRDRRG